MAVCKPFCCLQHISKSTEEEGEALRHLRELKRPAPCVSTPSYSQHTSRPVASELKARWRTDQVRVVEMVCVHIPDEILHGYLLHGSGRLLCSSKRLKQVFTGVNLVIYKQLM